jgi:hypothetical protein
MFLKVNYQVGLDINNCVAFYTNFDENLIARLHRDYDGICYGGNLILRVLSVVRTGECMFLNSTSATTGTLSVIFAALVVSYAPGDLIAGCVVGPIRDPTRVTMQSTHANAMIVQTGGDQDTAVLNTGAIVTVYVTGSYAGPGFDRISVTANLYEPSPITHYYPVMPGTSADAGEEMSVEKYIAIAQQDERGLTVVQAARLAADYLRATFAEIGADHTSLPDNVRQMFYPFRAEKAQGDARIATIDMLLDARVPSDATCLVACCEYNPLDGKIGVATCPLAELPGDWIKGELSQPVGVVLARRLERFIDFAYAAARMAREFADPAKLVASRNLIVLQAGKKK